MKRDARFAEVVRALARVRHSIEALRAAGEGLPAVEKNALRLSGTLRALEVQFTDLASALRLAEGG